MLIAPILSVGRGVTALIGGGGKTTLLYTLAEELRGRGRVVLCTTTKIRRPPQYTIYTGSDPAALRDALRVHGVVCAGTPYSDEKLQAPALSLEALAAGADYVLVEADGAHGRPLKAHAVYEPVIPKNAARTILVAGADGFGRPIREVCHRPELYARLAGAPEDAIVTPEMAARVIAAEGLGDVLYINKAEDETHLDAARETAQRLALPAAAGSLHKGNYICLF